MDQVLRIAEFILSSFLHIWPYLLITIPISVAVNVSGASRFITKAFSKNPLVAIFLATIVGAFSPFCSCGVIPVITSLLIGGVPLAPVMSFWIASPSMDPEIFFLSTSVLGWQLAVWRLASTFTISLLAGYITYYATRKGYIGEEVLRVDRNTRIPNLFDAFIQKIKQYLIGSRRVEVVLQPADSKNIAPAIKCCSTSAPSTAPASPKTECGCSKETTTQTLSLWEKILSETKKSVWMVVKFMSLAFLINALITFYIPQDALSKLLVGHGTSSVIIATLVGIPAYTSSITALPLVGGLLALGMSKGAALAFLIAGPTTTLPAMVAVWGIAKRRVFILYLSFVLLGAMLFGLLYNAV